MTDFSDSSKPTEPRRTAAISSGQFESGSVFRLVREIRGSAYSVGDQFMLIESEDCHNPNVLKLGGVGENYFIDPRGTALRIEAGDEQINGIFELVQTTPKLVVEEGQEVVPPTKHITEGEFRKFREGLAGVLHEISQVGSSGERGDRGPRGFTGVQGDKGDKGDTGLQGVAGEKGEPGEAGLQGPQGDKGDTGETGVQGERGIQGERGERGEKGERGENGKDGNSGERGAAGDKGETGERGEKGERGERGAAGADGRDGVAGPRGERGEAGERGADGAVGAAGAKGAKGDKGDKGDTGESGVVTAKFPLVYDADEKTISIDEERLDRILKKILGGGKVSTQDMGWLASTGGGGKVAVYINGSKITPDVRTLDFTGAGVTASKVGGKVTVNFTGTGGGSSGGVASVNGLSGAVFLEGGTDISVTTSGQTLTVTYTGSSVSNAVTSFNGITGAVTGVCAASAGTGISVSGSTGTVTITNTGVQSFNGITGAVQGVSSWNGQTGAVTFNNYVSSFNGITGAVQGVSAAVAGSGIFVSGATGEVTITNTGVVSFNGLTGAVQGVSSWNGQTGAVTFNNYVSSFNGLTGAVQGVSSANGLTGSIVFGGAAGITHTVSGNGISFGINYHFGGQTFESKTGSTMAGVDILLLQRKIGTDGNKMYQTTVQNLFQNFLPLYSAYGTAKISDSSLGSGSSSYSFLMSNSGSEGTISFAEQMKVIQSGMLFSTQGITWATGNSGTTLAINYRYGGATFAAKSGNPQNTDTFLIQEGGTGDMKTVPMSSIVSAVGEQAVTSVNGATGAVQGVSSVNGITGPFGISAGLGISFSVTGNTYSFKVSYTTTGVPTLGSVLDTDWLLIDRVKDANDIRRIRVLDFRNSPYAAETPSSITDYGTSPPVSSFVLQSILDGATATTYKVGLNDFKTTVLASIDGGNYT
jgi:hypothetical protein